MTTSRIVRGTKARVFLYVCAGLFIVGLVACYNNVRVQLDGLHVTYEQCRQQQENLSSQLQVFYDYKQRLEKSLKIEQGEHLRTKTEFESKLKQEKLKYEKTHKEEELKFSSQQQQYNLLKTQYNDVKDDCSNTQRKQLDEINRLQAKLKEVQEQLKRTENDKENSLQHLKTQNSLLKDEKLKLKEQLEKYQEHPPPAKHHEYSTTHFTKLQKLVDSQYVIPELKINDEERKVLAAPSNVLPPIKSSTSTPKSISRPEINAANPLKSPTVTPETIKRPVVATSKASRMNNLPAPFSSNKQVPEGVVPIPPDKDGMNAKLLLEKSAAVDENDLDNNRYRNIFDTKQTKADAKLKNNFNDFGEDTANEEFDIQPNHNKAGGKQHIDEMAAENKDEYDAQNVLDEAEEDDAVDGVNVDHAHDPAERN